MKIYIPMGRITGHEVIRLRFELEMTVKGFGAMFGVSSNTVIRWENGEKRPSAARSAWMREMQEALDAGRPPSDRAATPRQVTRLRDRFDVTHRDLAREFRVPVSTVEAWESGSAAPEPDVSALIRAMLAGEADPPANTPTPEEVASLRRRFGMNLRDFGEQFDVSAQSVFRWESGEKPPSSESCRLFWELFEIPPPEEEGVPLSRRSARTGAIQQDILARFAWDPSPVRSIALAQELGRLAHSVQGAGVALAGRGLLMTWRQEGARIFAPVGASAPAGAKDVLGGEREGRGPGGR